jgi:hypothetical protein
LIWLFLDERIAAAGRHPGPHSRRSVHEQYAATKKFDVSVLLSSRLAPDMQAFVYQVQSACDYVKGAAA